MGNIKITTVRQGDTVTLLGVPVWRPDWDCHKGKRAKVIKVYSKHEIPGHMCLVKIEGTGEELELGRGCMWRHHQ